MDNYGFVDLGLPSGLLWADRNVGANAIEEYGLYFALGDTVGYGQDTSDGHLFSFGTCPCGQSTPPMSTLDAATVNMGAEWRMPDRADYEELLRNCTTKWTIQNGVKGLLFASKVNGNTLFFPAAGYRNGSSLNYAGSDGSYWSRSPSSRTYALLYFDSRCCYTSNNTCYCGYSVRGVRAKIK